MFASDAPSQSLGGPDCECPLSRRIWNLYLCTYPTYHSEMSTKRILSRSSVFMTRPSNQEVNQESCLWLKKTGYYWREVEGITSRVCSVAAWCFFNKSSARLLPCLWHPEQALSSQKGIFLLTLTNFQQIHGSQITCIASSCFCRLGWHWEDRNKAQSKAVKRYERHQHHL